MFSTHIRLSHLRKNKTRKTALFRISPILLRINRKIQDIFSEFFHQDGNRKALTIASLLLRIMPKYIGSAKCPTCCEYYGLREYYSHVNLCNGSADPKNKEEMDFNKMTHEQAIDYYFNNPNLIEDGLKIKQKEVTILRGRIDLLGIDKNRKICFIEIIHKSHYDRAYYEKKIKAYRSHILTLINLVLGNSDDLRDKIRLLLIEPLNKAYFSELSQNTVKKSSKKEDVA